MRHRQRSTRKQLKDKDIEHRFVQTRISPHLRSRRRGAKPQPIYGLTAFFASGKRGKYSVYILDCIYTSSKFIYKHKLVYTLALRQGLPFSIGRHLCQARRLDDGFHTVHLEPILARFGIDGASH